MFTKYDSQFNTNKTTLISLDDIEQLILNPLLKPKSEKSKILFEEYYNCKPIGFIRNKDAKNPYTKDELKKKALKDFYVKYKQTEFPFVLFNAEIYDNQKHDVKNIKDFSGYMILDYDNLLEDELVNITNALKQISHVALIFRSPSNNGIKVLIKINKLLKAQHDNKYFKNYYDCVKDYIEVELYNILNKTYKADISGSNINRGCYISYDEHVYVNKRATKIPYTKTVVENIVQNKNQIIKQISPNGADTLRGTTDEINLIIKLVDAIKTNKISICDTYDSWIRVGFVLKRYIENLEVGKKLFDDISSVSKNYSGRTATYEKYESLYNASTSKEISITYILNLIRLNSNIDLFLDKKEKETIKQARVYTMVDVPRLLKQDNFKVVENIINHNIMISWDGQPEINYTKKGDATNQIIRRYFLENYNIDLNQRDFIYVLTNSDYTEINPPVELMKTYANKYKDMVDNEKNFLKICDLIPTEDMSDIDKYSIMKRYLLSVVNNLTYVRGKGRRCDEMLILRSEFTAGKTEAIRNVLFAPIINWKDQFMYSESTNFSTFNKDRLFIDLSSVINYKPEISHMLTRDANAIKLFLSQETYTIRRAYRSNEEEFITRTSFIGDTNNEYYLPNDNNLRRFLIINITDKLKFKTKDEITGKYVLNTNVNYEQLWGYLYNLHISGITYDTVDLPLHNNMRDSIAIDYDDAIIKSVIKPAKNEYFTIDELLIKLKENNLFLKDTTFENVRIKIRNLGFECKVKWDKIQKKSIRKFYEGRISIGLDNFYENENNNEIDIYDYDINNMNSLLKCLKIATDRKDIDMGIKIKTDIEKLKKINKF